jgi:flagellar biosynthesis GTPase FlhF
MVVVILQHNKKHNKMNSKVKSILMSEDIVATPNEMTNAHDGSIVASITLSSASFGAEEVITIDEFDTMYRGFVRCWPAVKPLKSRWITACRDKMLADRAEEKRMKAEQEAADKETARAAKEADRAAKEAEKEAARVAKAAEKEAAREAKAAEKEAKAAEKEAKAAEKEAKAAEKEAKAAEKEAVKSAKQAKAVKGASGNGEHRTIRFDGRGRGVMKSGGSKNR